MRVLGDWDCVIIPQGWHRSMALWYPMFRDTLKFQFYFSETGRYIFHDGNEEAVNKIVGFADGRLNHHKNSFRIGWNYDSQNDRIRIYAYTYVDGVRGVWFLGFTNLFEENAVIVKCMKGQYRVIFNNEVFHIPRSKRIKWKYKHLLWPYFGGVRKAPHSIAIFLKWRQR